MLKSCTKLFSILVILLCLPALALATGSYQSPLQVEGAETVDLQQARQLYQQGAVFVDVRNRKQYSKRHIPGAVNLFLNETFNQQNLLKYVQKDQPFIVYCNGVHCSLSHKAARKAVSWGFTQTKYFRGGMRHWRKAGHEMEYGNSHPG